MHKLAFAAAAAAVAALAAAPVSAASNRTWVSSTGSGTTCSQSSPCATFQVAHDNTNADGEINCVNSADYGILTISKSISINCDGAPGRVMSGGTNTAITINATAAGKVVLSGLDLNGIHPSSNFGVAIFNAGGSVQIRNSVVQGFASGIYWRGTNSSQLVVSDSFVLDNNFNINFDVSQAATSALNAHFNNVRIQNGNYGVFVSASAIGVNVNLRDCQISGASQAGVVSIGSGYAAATVFNTQLVGNFGPALLAQGSGTSVIRVGNSSILSNATAISTASAGQVLSFGDNNVSGNSNGETFSGALLAKK